MKTVGILQARTGSSRLPRKVLLPIEGAPMIARVLERAAAASRLDELVVAIPDLAEDDELAAVINSLGFPVHRGDADDVLARFVGAVERSRADVAVRLTADCPLHDPAIIDATIESFLSGPPCDYASNTLEPTFPDGLDVEVLTVEALRRADAAATLPHEREHITPVIRAARASDAFTTRSVTGTADFSHLRWTVDDAADLEFVRSVYARLDRFTWLDVLALVTAEPGLLTLNAGSERNEGLAISLAAESARDDLAESRALLARARRVIPSATQTFSKGPTQFVEGASPAFLERGRGCRVWDVDGNEYVDYAMGLGPVVLGHDDPVVARAVVRQIRRGTAFTLPHRLEVEVAELLVETVPCAEMVRFGKNGSDATAAAVRAARALTGRDVIACCGYHGWQDWFIGTTTRSLGVPAAVRELTLAFPYNDLDALRSVFERHSGRVAAVVMEPVGVEPPEPGYLEAVRDLTARHGALLVFDEVVTGFRLALGGAQEHFGVVPDIACVGKAMANGFPLSAVVGRREAMEVFDEVFFSGTFGGETASLAAAQATIGEIRSRSVRHLWHVGAALQEGLNARAERAGLAGIVSCDGLPPRTVVAFHDADGADALLLKSLFQQECIRRGILFTGSHNVTFSHDEAALAETLAAYEEALAILADAIRRGDAAARLHGRPVQPVFRRP